MFILSFNVQVNIIYCLSYLDWIGPPTLGIKQYPWELMCLTHGHNRVPPGCDICFFPFTSYGHVIAIYILIILIAKYCNY